MVFRQCNKCKVIFDRKSTFDNHMNRKTDCSINNNSNNSNNSNELNDEVSHKLTQINTNSQKLTENQNNTDIFIKETTYSNISKSDFGDLTDLTDLNDCSNSNNNNLNVFSFSFSMSFLTLQ